MNLKEKIANYDSYGDVFYFCMEKGIEEEFVEVAPGVSVELDSRGRVIGIEILNMSKTLC